jgi:hypothetical protein
MTFICVDEFQLANPGSWIFGVTWLNMCLRPIHRPSCHRPAWWVRRDLALTMSLAAHYAVSPPSLPDPPDLLVKLLSYLVNCPAPHILVCLLPPPFFDALAEPASFSELGGLEYAVPDAPALLPANIAPPPTPGTGNGAFHRLLAEYPFGPTPYPLPIPTGYLSPDEAITMNMPVPSDAGPVDFMDFSRMSSLLPVVVTVLTNLQKGHWPRPGIQTC